MTAELFAVAWLLKVTACHGAAGATVEQPMPQLYLCQARAATIRELARPDRKVTAECVTVEGREVGA